MEEIKSLEYSYMWFSLCSQRYRRTIKDFSSCSCDFAAVVDSASSKLLHSSAV
ncbi:unnamed protein product, partial [Sphagnum jensenii]